MSGLYIQKLTDQAALPPQEFLDQMSDLVFRCSLDSRRLLYLNSRATGFFGWSNSEAQQFNPWWEILFAPESHAAVVSLLNHAVNAQVANARIIVPARGTQPIDDVAREDSHRTSSREASIQKAASPIADAPDQARRSADSRAGLSIRAPGEDAMLARNAGGSVLPIRFHSAFIAGESLLLLANYSIDAVAAEEILRQTQARFRSIVDSLSINLLLKDLDGKRLYANRAYLNLRNVELADVIGKTDEELFPTDIAEQYRRDDWEVMRTGKILHKFEENISHTGERSWTEAIKGPLRDADNQIAGVQILFWDATDRKSAELAFERERYLLHALLDNVPDSIYFKDRESRFVRISRGMARKFSFDDPMSVVGKTDADIFTEEHAIQARGDELEIMKTGEPMVAHVERETWPDAPDTWCSTTKMPLRDANGEIVGTFGISRDVTELIHAEHLLREARDAADSANRAKSDFLANMSHEIRTPMNGIIGMAELLRNTQLSDAQRSFLEMIDSSAHSLLRIINDILDFSKIEAGKLDLESVPFDIRKCVSHAAKSLAVRAAEKSVELILEIDIDIPDMLSGDPVRLRQVLVNLVGNAIKFTKDGEISIRVAVADGPPVAANYTLHFAVSDTGIGIPPAKQQTIFEAFSQADVSTTRQYGGTGLGLSISGQLVEMMNGRIWLESEVDVGSTFHFTAVFPPSVDSVDPADEPEDETLSLSGMPALLIDENVRRRESMQAALARRGLLVSAVSNLSDAAQACDRVFAETSPRGALIIDHALEETVTRELVAKLQKIPTERRPVTLLLSTATHPLSEDLIKSHQIDSVLQKPALQSEICNAIRHVLASRVQGEQPIAIADEAPPSSERGLRFLLAEDGVVNRAVFVGLLEGRGHSVTAVEDGQAAVDAWRDFEFHAIFMDVQMPILDGIEATRVIRREEAESGAHIPIIAITAAAMESDHTRCLAAGMDDYLSKPVDFVQFDRLLEKLRTGNLGEPHRERALQHAATDARASQKLGQHPINFDAPVTKLNCSQEQQRQLVCTFENEARQRLAEVSQALDEQDDKLLVRATHSLKSAAGLFEADELESISGLIERHARAGETASARQHFPELRDATTAILGKIHAWLEAL